MDKDPDPNRGGPGKSVIREKHTGRTKSGAGVKQSGKRHSRSGNKPEPPADTRREIVRRYQAAETEATGAGGGVR